jgi:hypothetical protein
MTTVTLQGELGRRVSIIVRGYEREVSLDPFDANWLRCSTEVEQGAFRGAVDATFATSDFSRFLSELDRVMSGSSGVASFTTMEEALAFRVEVDRSGRATITGKLRELGEFGTDLSFTFESDRSFLTATHSDLKRIVATFPERTVGT